MPTLTYTTAARIASREMRSSRGKFFFVILSVAIGVAALTGVRGFSSSFRATLLDHARSIMAADLAARTTQQPTPAEARGLADIEAEGVRLTPVTELTSMASDPRTFDPLLISLKAVDPTQYPFYGTVDLDPAGSLASDPHPRHRRRRRRPPRPPQASPWRQPQARQQDLPHRRRRHQRTRPPLQPVCRRSARPHLPPGPGRLRPHRARLPRRPALPLQTHRPFRRPPYLRRRRRRTSRFASSSSSPNPRSPTTAKPTPPSPPASTRPPACSPS